MDVEQFWKLSEKTRQISHGAPDKQADLLIDELAIFFIIINPRTKRKKAVTVPGKYSFRNKLKPICIIPLPTPPIKIKNHTRRKDSRIFLKAPIAVNRKIINQIILNIINWLFVQELALKIDGKAL